MVGLGRDGATRESLRLLPLPEEESSEQTPLAQAPKVARRSLRLRQLEADESEDATELVQPAEARKSQRLDTQPDRQQAHRNPRTLYPGDMIAYWSPVVGINHRRGVSRAVIVLIDPYDDDRYPIQVNRLEVLPLWTRLKPIQDRHGAEVTEPMMALTSFKLVRGSFEAPRREATLNALLRAAVDKAFARTFPGPRSQQTNQQEEGAGSRGGEHPRVAELDPEQQQPDEAVQEDGTTTTRNGATVTALKARSTSVDESEESDERANSDQERVDQEHLESFEALLTLEQRRLKHKRAKDRLGTQRLSRKVRHAKMRKANRDSQSVFNAQVPARLRLQELMRTRAARIALIRGREQRTRAAMDALIRHRDELVGASDAAGRPPQQESDSAAPGICSEQAVERPGASGAKMSTPPSDCSVAVRARGRSDIALSTVLEAGAHIDAEWPVAVARVCEQQNPDGVRFEKLDDFGKCDCVRDCKAKVCVNSVMGIYCTGFNCSVGGTCSNSLWELDSLRLFRSQVHGLGVYTQTPIEAGVVVAEYCGVLEPYEGIRGDNADVSRSPGEK